MKEILKDIFYYNKKERNGILVVIILIVLLLIFNKTAYLIIKPEKIDYSEFQAQIDTFKNSLIPKDDEEYENRLDQFIIDKYDTLDLFNFDPNAIKSEDWLKLGLTEKQIKTINTYVERGGKFVTKDDFRKIYGIRQKQFEILKPYIQLPESETSNSSFSDYFTNQDNSYSPDSTFRFNPNNASDTLWGQLGLTQKQINMINKYLSKGGKFYKKEDLLKIYGLDQTAFDKIEPFIQLESDTVTTVNNTETSDVEITTIEINSASQDEITQLFGKYDYYSAKIIKFRTSLGGFHDKAQLLEVYGFKEETYNKIKDYITVDESAITKIRLNFCEYDELNNHPYIDYNLAKAILKYRTKNGAFTKMEQLLKVEGITQEVYDKVKFYLTIE